MKHIRRFWQILAVVCVMVPLAVPVIDGVLAEGDLAAVLEVFEAGVEVKRVGTSNWVPVKVESVVGTGDYIRTNDTGKARITFFDDGTSVQLEPTTEYFIAEFSGTEDQFTLSVEVLLGITRQQFGRLLDSGSSYEVITPGAAMVVRGTNFDLRVEDNGRSSVLTFEGLVQAQDQGQSADVPPGYGLRSEVDAALSAVVPATTFDELDAALDGCAGGFETEADVRLNVRIGPGSHYARVASVAPSSINLITGVDESGGWYRIPFRGGFGWISGSLMTVDLAEGCTPVSYASDSAEDITSYTMVGELEVNAHVVVDNANLRSGPGTNYAVLDTLSFGTELIITGRNLDGDWVRVRDLDGQSGWIAPFLLESYTDLMQVDVIEDDVPASQGADAAATPASESSSESDAGDVANTDVSDDEPDSTGG